MGISTYFQTFCFFPALPSGSEAICPTSTTQFTLAGPAATCGLLQLQLQMIVIAPIEPDSF